MADFKARLSVLIIENNTIDTKILEDMLSRTDYGSFEVSTTDSLKDAFHQLTQKTFDAAVLDLNLRDSRGLDTLHKLNEQFPDLPIVINTGAYEDALGLKAVTSGAQDYLIKGQVDSQVLVRAIRYAVERKKTERTLQVAEQRYRMIFENSAVAIMMVNEEEQLVSWNKFTEDLLNMTYEDLHLKSIRSFYPNQEWDKIRAQNVRRKGIQHHLETKMIQKDGGVIDVDVSLSVLKDAEDHVVGSIGVIRDITERKRAQERLDRSYGLINATLESTADGILAVDNHGKITSFNRKFVEMWSLPQAELEAQDTIVVIESILDQLINGDEFLREVRHISSQSERISSGLLEFKDGRTVEHYSQPQYMSDQVTGRVWSFRDVTERKRVEKALRKSEERFRQVVDNAEEWIWEVDADGLFTYISPVVERILGFKPEEILGKKYFYDLFHPNERASLKKKAFEVFARKDTFREFETKILDKNGNVAWLSKSGVPLLNDDGELIGYRGVDVDITERRRIHEILNRKQKNLEAIFDAAPIGMLLIDEGVRVRRANDAIRNMACKDYAEIINQLPGVVLGCRHAAADLNNTETRCGRESACNLAARPRHRRRVRRHRRLRRVLIGRRFATP